MKYLITQFVIFNENLRNSLLFGSCFPNTQINIHSFNTRYAHRDNLHKTCFRNNTGKQTITVMASNLWQNLPSELKNLNTHAFNKNARQHLLLKGELNPKIDFSSFEHLGIVEQLYEVF